MYIEASLARMGQAARLQSPTIEDFNRGNCMRLWYNMYGSNIGQLDILLMDFTSKQTTTLWSAEGKLSVMRLGKLGGLHNPNLPTQQPNHSLFKS